MDANGQGQPKVDDAFLAGIVDAAFHPYVVVARDGTLLYVSAAVADLLGAPAEHYVGCNMVEVLHPHGLDRTVQAFQGFTSPERADTGWTGPGLTIILRHVDGHPVTCRALAVPSGRRGFDGLVLQIRATESTSKLDTAITSMVSGDRLETTIRAILDFANEQMPFSIGVVGLGFDGSGFRSIVAHHRAPTFGDTALPTDVRPTPWRAVLDGADVAFMDGDHLHAEIAEVAIEGGMPACWAHIIDRTPHEQDVLVFWRRATGAPPPHLAEAVARIRRLIVLAIDADRTRRILERQASTDDLTGLANRTVLFDRLDALGADPPDEALAILYLDLDDFKAVNDEQGHSVGDRVLEAAARRIERNVRAGDVVARVGGDEFAALCLGASRDELERMAERLVDAFVAPVTVDGREYDLGISVGIALLERHDELVDPEQLLDRADAAMLRAKALGKRRWQFVETG